MANSKKIKPNNTGRIENTSEDLTLTFLCQDNTN